MALVNLIAKCLFVVEWDMGMLNGGWLGKVREWEGKGGFP